MRIFRYYQGLPEAIRGASVAVGNFDGIHRGHQAIIGKARRVAKAEGIPLAVLTFEPHPCGVFNPDTAPFRLTPFRIKARHVEALGVDVMVALRFDPDFAKIPARAFIRDILVGGLGVRHVVSGYDFAFGHKHAGDCKLLLSMGEEEGYGFTCARAVRDGEGIVYSSTRVREYLKNADPAGAAHVLGRHFEIEGRVEHGDKRGGAIGFPTANLPMGEYQHPARGVYAVRAKVGRGGKAKWLDGVANFGTRPTFKGRDEVFEVHLLNFSGDLYDKRLRVAVIDYIRSEVRFSNPDELKAQIAADCGEASRILARP